MRTAVGITCCLLAAASFSLPAHAATPIEITATVETGPNWDDEAGGHADADDPAIWVNRADPARSLVLGTLKNGGLTVVDLAGRQLQHVPTPPRPNPVRSPAGSATSTAR